MTCRDVAEGGGTVGRFRGMFLRNGSSGWRWRADARRTVVRNSLRRTGPAAYDAVP
ncbi:hypothetical protein SY2F82_40300 [Streptomyces sp. Y2F8-2]|nr:hypothetical protein SY2F82_40300 [Streptomyces sp. Y2F8-2]